MAEGFAPQTQGNPGAAAGLGNNPFSANYWNQVALLNFQTEKALGEDQRNVRDTEATYRYNLGANQRAEPIKLRAGQNTANAQGLAESGVLAQRQGLTQTDFASKNARLAEGRKTAVEKYQTLEKNKVQEYGLNTAAKLTTAQAEILKQQEENPTPSYPTASPAQAGINPGGSRQNIGGPGNNGVQPYVEKLPGGGSVNVGTPRAELQKLANSPWSRDPQVRQRQEAAKRALGVG